MSTSTKFQALADRFTALARAGWVPTVVRNDPPSKVTICGPGAMAAGFRAGFRIMTYAEADELLTRLETPSAAEHERREFFRLRAAARQANNTSGSETF